MKILFVNPPVVRFKNQSPESDPHLNAFFSLKMKFKDRRILYGLFDHAGIGKDMRFGVRAGSRWPWTADYPPGAVHYPFIMGYAAGFLRSQGYNVNLIDAVADNEFSYDRFIDRVKGEHADIVVIECSTPTIDIDLWIAKRISGFAEVALAGPHLVEFAGEIREKHPHIAYLLKGEYIKSALTMAQTKARGIYEPDIVTDMDALPFPFRDYATATKYFDPSMPTARPQLQIYASKGCPFKCSFCLWPQTMYNRKVSLRDPGRIAGEIRECVDRYGYKSIFFDDDTFNLGNDRISRLCDELKQIGIPWTMMGRLDCSPEWLYDKMVDCGCVGMRFGVETFDIEVLKRINKGIERVDFRNTLENLSKKYPRLMIHVTMMRNLPGQSEEAHQRDMTILKDMGYSNHNILRTYQLASCVPFPGTRLYDDLMKENNGRQLNDFSLYDGAQDTVMSRMAK